jgi:thiol:disulfide interchange protein DsbG
MKRYLKALTLFTALAVSPGLLLAGSDKARALVNKFVGTQANIVKQFTAVGDVQGFVLSPKANASQKTIVYAQKDGQYFFAGTLVSGDGHNLTQENVATYITAAMAPKVWQGIQKTNYIEQGKANAPHKLYVIAEPNCSACHLLYKSLQPMIKSGQLAVRWVFVAFLRPTSVAQVATIFQAKDPIKALQADEANFDMAHEMGAIKPAKNVRASDKAKVEANMKFMMSNGFIATPVTIFMDKDNKPQIVRGFLPGKALTDKVNTASNRF